MSNNRLCLFAILAVSFFASVAQASELRIDRRMPDETMTTGGLSLGLGQAGSALVTDISAVRMNPANIALRRQYTLTGVYHWPSFGRPYYQAGVIDSQTAGFAAGVSYTGFADNFTYDPAGVKRDSQLHQRVTVGLATIVGKVAVGVNFQHVSGYKLDEAESLEPVPVKGLSLGLGVSGMIIPKLRFGISGENINNREIEHLAPRVLRAGLAYFALRDILSVHLDYHNRQRLAGGVEYGMLLPQGGLRSDSPADLALIQQVRRDEEKYAKAEQMLTGSFSLQVYDMLRLLGAYGQAIGHERQMIAGGLAMVNGPTTIAFTAARPYLSRESTQQAFHLGFGLSM